MEYRFNVRVYGIWIHKGKVLLSEEGLHGRTIIKFPGGGLDYGEGTIECLKREFIEELGLEPEIIYHYYTTDFFQKSILDESQIISIYYRVRCDPDELLDSREPGHLIYWKDVDEVDENTFTLPIDKIVGGMIRKDFE